MSAQPLDVQMAAVLLKAQGVLSLIKSATEQMRIDDPMPDGVQTSIEVAADLVDDALRIAGAIS